MKECEASNINRFKEIVKSHEYHLEKYRKAYFKCLLQESMSNKESNSVDRIDNESRGSRGSKEEQIKMFESCESLRKGLGYKEWKTLTWKENVENLIKKCNTK